MFLNDEEIANLVAGQENDPSIGDPDEEEPAQFTRAEKLTALSRVISMLNPADSVEHQDHCQPRRIQNTRLKILNNRRSMAGLRSYKTFEKLLRSFRLKNEL